MIYKFSVTYSAFIASNSSVRFSSNATTGTCKIKFSKTLGDISPINATLTPLTRTLPTLPLIKDVIGRTADMITSPGGEIIVPEFFWNPWREIKGLRQAQLIQEDRDKLLLKLVISDEFDKEKSLSHLEAIYKKRMGNISIQYDFADDIPREKSGKYRMVD